MQILPRTVDLRAALSGQDAITFVPTMGNLHAGHIALMKAARNYGRLVVASIFVNRLQFGPSEDFDRYPRTFDSDCAQLREAGVDILFAPDEAELYPEPQQYQVDPPASMDILEGAVRPGHFRGVATVVLKLFNIVAPHTAVFGKKDYQQLMLIRNMVRQLALPVSVIGEECVRAGDGLALSSRNGYLSPEERAEAPRLHRALSAVGSQIRAGEGDFASLERQAIADLAANGWKVDYFVIRRQSDLALPETAEASELSEPLVVLAAARLGNTRLIDNLEINCL